MTKIPLKLKKWQKYYQNPENDQNTPKTQKMTKIPPKPKKWPKFGAQQPTVCNFNSFLESKLLISLIAGCI